MRISEVRILRNPYSINKSLPALSKLHSKLNNPVNSWMTMWFHYEHNQDLLKLFDSFQIDMPVFTDIEISSSVPPVRDIFTSLSKFCQSATPHDFHKLATKYQLF